MASQSISTHTLQFILEFPNAEQKIAAFKQMASTAVKDFEGGAASGKLTRAQARTAAGYQGRLQGAATAAYQGGAFGPVGSKEAKDAVTEAKRLIREQFKPITDTLSEKSLVTYKKEVNQAEKEMVAILREEAAQEAALAAASKGESGKKAAEEVRTTQAKKRVRLTSEEQAKAEEAASKLGLNALKEKNKADNAAVREARRRLRIATEANDKAQAAVIATSRDYDRASGREDNARGRYDLRATERAEAEARLEAANAAVAKAKRQKKAAGSTSAVGIEVQEAAYAAQLARERELKAAEELAARNQTTKAAKVKADIAVKEASQAQEQLVFAREAARAAQAEASASEEAVAVALKKVQSAAVAERQKDEADKRTVRAKKAEAKTAEGKAAVEGAAARARTPKGEKIYGIGEQPETKTSQAVRQQIAELDKRILRNAQLLAQPPPELTRRGTADALFNERLEILAQQNAALRVIRAAKNKEAKDAEREVALQQQYGAEKNRYDLEAAQAADDRAEAIRAGTAKEAALLQQLDGTRRGINAAEDDILKLVGEERALKAARVALEKSSETRALSRTVRGPDGKFTSLRQTVVQGQFDAAKETAIQQAQLAERLAADKTYTKARAEAAAIAQKQALLERVAVEKRLGADVEYARAQESAALLKQEATLKDLAFQATNTKFQEQEVAIRVQTNAIRISQRNKELEMLAADEAAIKEKARGVVLEEQYNRLLAKEVQTQAAEAGLTRGGLLGKLAGTGGGGRGLGGGGRYGIGEGGGFGGFFGSGALTTLKYALPSAILFGAAAAITKTVKEAEELERQMTLIEAQFISADKAAEFPRFRGAILEIARETGLAADEVAKIGFQLQGAFDAIDAQSGKKIEISGLSGQDLVESQLQASAEIAKVTGLTQEEIVDSLTATSFAFDASFREIGNVTLDLQGRFGVLAKEIIPFLGDIAPVAKDAGFSLEEFATIAAITQQKSGRSGSALAEAYGRVLPAVTEAKNELIDLATTNQALNNQDFLTAVSQGDVSEILLQIASNFSSMDKSSQDFVINLLGGRREASAILAAFTEGDSLLREINRTQRDNNALSEQFQELQESVAERVQVMLEKFRQLGVQFFEAGLGDALKLMADAAGALATALTKALELFSGLNSALGGIPAKLLAIYAAMKLIQVINNRLNVGTTLASFGSRAVERVSNIGRAADSASALGYARSGPRFPSLRGGGFLGGVRQAGSNFRQGINNNGPLVYAAAALSLFELKSARDEQAENLRRAGEALTERLQQQSEEEVATFLEARQGLVNQIQQDGFAATIGAFVTGQKSIQARGVDAAQLQSAPRTRAALEELKDIVSEQEVFRYDQFGQATRITRQEIQDILNRFNEDPTSDTAYQEARDAIYGLAELDQATKDRINAALAQGQATADAEIERQQEQHRAQIGVQNTTQNLESIKAAYESGDANIQNLAAAYQRKINTLRQSLEAAGNNDPTLLQALRETEAEQSQVVSQALLDAVSFQQEIAEVTGAGTPQGDIQRLLALLDDPQFTDPESRRQVALDILDLQQSVLQARAEAADSAREALRILRRGVRIPRRVRVELIRQQLGQNNVEFARFVNQSVGVAGDIAESFRDNVVEALTLGQRGVRLLVRQLRTRRRDLVRLLTNAAGTAGLQNASAELQAIDDLLTRLEDEDPFGVQIPTRVRGSREDRQSALEDVRSEAQDARDEARDRAERQQERARELADARADFFRAVIENDPVALARFELQEADRAFNQAENEAERVRAQAERIRAQRRLQEAIQDVFNSQFELLTAMFNYAGETVHVAQVGLRQAQANLDYLQRSGAGDAAINRAKAAVIDAQAGLRDARLQRRLDDYAFLYDMERINRQQYIAYLMQLREIPDLTRDQLRALDRQIKQLRDELGADFQFNLPTTLGLPTLYEVRRTNQTPGGISAYNDNRVVTINVNVANSADIQALEAVLSNSVGTNVNGTVPRRY